MHVCIYIIREEELCCVYMLFSRQLKTFINKERSNIKSIALETTYNPDSTTLRHFQCKIAKYKLIPSILLIDFRITKKYYRKLVRMSYILFLYKHIYYIYYSF